MLENHPFNLLYQLTEESRRLQRSKNAYPWMRLAATPGSRIVKAHLD